MMAVCAERCLLVNGWWRLAGRACVPGLGLHAAVNSRSVNSESWLVIAAQEGGKDGPQGCTAGRI